MRPGAEPDLPRRRWAHRARWVTGAVATVGGVAVALLVAAIGHCSAFGGRCPADPEPLLHNDVFVLVAATIAITGWIVAVCLRPDRSGVAVGFLAGLVLGASAGLVAVLYAAG